MNMNLSNSLLDKFKNRNSFKRYRLFGGTGNVNVRVHPALQRTKRRMQLTQFFNNDAKYMAWSGPTYSSQVLVMYHMAISRNSSGGTRQV